MPQAGWRPCATLVTGLGLLESPRWHDGPVVLLGLDRRRDPQPGRRRSQRGRDAARLVAAVLRLRPGRRDARGVLGDPCPAPNAPPGPKPERIADLAPLSQIVANDIVVDGRGNAYVNSNDAEFGVTAAAGGHGPHRPGHTRRAGPGRGRRSGLPERHGRDPGQRHARRRRVLPAPVDGVRDLRRRQPGRPAGVRRPGRRDARRHLPRRRGSGWFADVPNRCFVRVHDGGQERERVDLPRGGFACMLGGADGRTLFAVGATWPGAAAFESATGGERPQWHGTVWSTQAPAAAAGWPGT